jgi:hypothetical protein
MPPQFSSQRTSVRFLSPSMKIAWAVPGPDGKPRFGEAQIETPGRYNFLQAAIYRLKLFGIEGQPGVELYPTLEVVPANHRTNSFLAHSAVPVAFTEDDFAQVASGNYVVKVIYLPDPTLQDLAVVGPNEISSTTLPPGADPVLEAQRRGSILLIIRMGNIDLEAPNTPPMDAPNPYFPPPGMHPPHGPAAPVNPMVPYGFGGPPHGMTGPRPPWMPPNGPMPGTPPGAPGAPKGTAGAPAGPNTPPGLLMGTPDAKTGITPPAPPSLPPSLPPTSSLPPSSGPVQQVGYPTPAQLAIQQNGANAR